MKTTGPKYAKKEFQKRVENNYVVTLEELSPFQADIKQESIKNLNRLYLWLHLQYGTHELRPGMKGFETDCLPATKKHD